METQATVAKSVEGLCTADVQGVEIPVINSHGDAFTIRKFRRSRGDYYSVRHPSSGTVERFSALEKAKTYMLASRHG